MQMRREGVSSGSSVVSHNHWRDAVLEPSIAGSARGTTPPSSSGSPTRTWVLILTHLVDLVVLVFMGVAAAFLRFGDLYLIRPQLTGVGGLCLDLAYAQPRRDPAIDVPLYACDILAIAAPIVLIGLLELTVTVALQRQILRTGASTNVFFFKRFAKSVLVFLLGLCVTSLLTDLVRLFVSRPRPYFLANNDFPYGYRRYCSPGASEDSFMGWEERDARLSFPCYRCSVLAYAGAVVAIRAERSLRRLRLGGVYMMRALALVLAVQPALLLASQALDSRSNHWQDIVVGLLLGAALGAYAELVLGRDLEAQLEDVSAVPLEVPGIPIHALPRPQAGSPPPLTTAQLAAVIEESNGLHQRPKTIQRPDNEFY